MFKYFHIIKFLMTHDLTELKSFWEIDVIRNKKFSYPRLIRRLIKSKSLQTNYLFWWRLASSMHQHNKYKETAVLINNKLTQKYNIEIMLGAKIGKNPYISHFSGIVISSQAKIGDNFVIKQNSTIGVKTLPEYVGYYAKSYNIEIGDNVTVGAGSFIISDNIKIGHNVKIGAMSFIDKDILDNCIVYTKKTNEIIEKAH